MTLLKLEDDKKYYASILLQQFHIHLLYILHLKMEMLEFKALNDNDNGMIDVKEEEEYILYFLMFSDIEYSPFIYIYY